jgi:hypothetical protein
MLADSHLHVGGEVKAGTLLSYMDGAGLDRATSSAARCSRSRSITATASSIIATTTRISCGSRAVIPIGLPPGRRSILASRKMPGA